RFSRRRREGEYMHRLWLRSVGIAALLAAGCAQQMASTAPTGSNVTLSGAQEVPPVNTAATGSGTISVLMGRSVSGSVATSVVAATAAHIHMAAPGQNGPVIVPLNKTGENVWAVPDSIRFNDAQYEAYRLGHLYVKLHSAPQPPR